MTKNNFKCIFLGCDANEAGTYLIHLEYYNKVAYRKRILISKKILEENIIKIVKVNYFHRPKKILYDFNKAFNKIITMSKKVNLVEIKFGTSFSLTLKDFFKYGNIMFKKNKSILIKIK
jgi:hypothetical protein